MAEVKQPSHVVWEYEGAFSIVLRDTEFSLVCKPFLKKGGFKTAGNVASCNKVKILGFKDHPHYKGDGVAMPDLPAYIRYDAIERIVAGDGTILWSR